jgi:hypothetical protein
VTVPLALRIAGQPACGHSDGNENCSTASTGQALADLRNEVRETNRRADALRDAVETNFRITFGALITTTLGLAALMAKGFHWF